MVRRPGTFLLSFLAVVGAACLYAEKTHLNQRKKAVINQTPFGKNTFSVQRPNRISRDLPRYVAARPIEQENISSCLNQVPPPERKPEICLTALGFCVARTIDGGREHLDSPIEVEFGCINRIDEREVLVQGCQRGIEPSRFQEGDIRCGANKGN